MKDDQEKKDQNKKLGYYRKSLTGDDRVNLEDIISLQKSGNYNLFNTSFKKVDDESEEYLSDEEIEQITLNDESQNQSVANNNNSAPADDLDDDLSDQVVNAGEPKKPAVHKTLFSEPEQNESSERKDPPSAEHIDSNAKRNI